MSGRVVHFEVPYDEPVMVNRIVAVQNEGSHHLNVFRIRTERELKGAPGEVYERPNSPFVADFVGSSNVLPPDFAAAHGGARAWTSLRPEKVMVMTQGASVAADQAGADGVIVSVSYQGAATRYGVTTGAQRLIAEAPSGTAAFKQGDAVRLVWPRTAMVTMEEAP